MWLVVNLLRDTNLFQTNISDFAKVMLIILKGLIVFGRQPQGVIVGWFWLHSAKHNGQWSPTTCGTFCTLRWSSPTSWCWCQSWNVVGGHWCLWRVTLRGIVAHFILRGGRARTEPGPSRGRAGAEPGPCRGQAKSLLEKLTWQRLFSFIYIFRKMAEIVLKVYIRVSANFIPFKRD